MPLTLDTAFVYDIECFPDVFTVTAESLYGDQRSTWEISPWRNDAPYLYAWLDYLRQTQTIMIGFNSVGYDYPMLHHFFTNPNCGYEGMYAKNQSIFASQDRFSSIIWDRDRFAPQIDLFKVHHFDNKAKTTDLKSLEINMRSERVVESDLPFGVPVGDARLVDQEVIPYNVWDVSETKKFAHYSLVPIRFRLGLVDTMGIDVLNYSNAKLGEKILEQRIGEDVCYTRDQNNRKQRRQTWRRQIALKDIIFPYIRFDNPEFQRILAFKMAQVLRPEDLEDPDAEIKTKGAYKIEAHVGGLAFHFGTGGVHASQDRKVFRAGNGWIIRDIDVEGLYPNVAIANNLAPKHLGAAFTTEYAKIPAERKTHAKGTPMNAGLKEAANAAWGKSNSQYSCFYDPQYAMTIPINGQLMICMLAEKLIEIPTVSLIQANTDGITYMIHESYLDQAKQVEADWQALTRLKLEDVHYKAMWIRDVNNYIAQDTKGKLKLKGAYWYPDPLDYANSISNASPACWHKDFNPIIVQRAAVAAMVYGIPPESFITAHTDPFDFMLRTRAKGVDRLEFNGRHAQKSCRYYVAKQGGKLIKVAPPPKEATLGAYKKKNGISWADYNRVMEANGGAWDASIHTGNQSVYEMRKTEIESGYTVALCNDAKDFDFANLNYAYYIAQAHKLIIS